MNTTQERERAAIQREQLNSITVQGAGTLKGMHPFGWSVVFFFFRVAILYVVNIAGTQAETR